MIKDYCIFSKEKGDNMPNKETRYSLRERKYAKTKISLANAFMERLKTKRFSDIAIKEVCENVEVSEGTFYNYFQCILRYREVFRERYPLLLPQQAGEINFFQY